MLILSIVLFILIIFVIYYWSTIDGKKKISSICPYCNQKVSFKEQAKVVKCENCHHKSVVQSGQLTKL